MKPGFGARTLRRFMVDDGGAVTVDWTVLAAAIVGLGVATVAAVRTGVVNLGDGISGSLSSASIALLSIGDAATSAMDGYQLLYAWQNDDVLGYWNAEVFPTMSNDDLVAQYTQYVGIAANGTIPAFMDFSYAMLTEMTARGLATDEHVVLFETAYAAYS